MPADLELKFLETSSELFHPFAFWPHYKVKIVAIRKLNKAVMSRHVKGFS